MAEVASQISPSLSEQYHLPKEEKVSKLVEEIKVESPVSVKTPVEEVVSEKVETPTAAEESSEPLADAATESSDVPSDAAENSHDELAAVTEGGRDTVEEQDAETEEASEEAPEVKLETAPADFRFPTTNQTRHCFTRYIEYHRCIAAKGEDAPECNRFAKYYRSLCPGEWIDRWNEERENGTFPGPL